MTLAQRTTNGAQTHHPAPISTIAAEPAAKPHAAVQGWKGCDIATLCQSSDLGAIYNTWMLLATGNLPRLNEVMANEQFAMLGNTALLLKLPHYLLFVHHGAAMALMIGRQFTGVLH
ncbi:MAG: hypothetical protein HY659_00685 [Rhizobiales bacterium]|nr:hypothetical protein [Hyphomicrobiales bacterium]